MVMITAVMMTMVAMISKRIFQDSIAVPLLNFKSEQAIWACFGGAWAEKYSGKRQNTTGLKSVPGPFLNESVKLKEREVNGNFH